MENLRKYLKIKDKINLDELLKYGFIKCKENGSTVYYIEDPKCILNENDEEVFSEEITEDTELTDRDVEEIGNNIIVYPRNRYLMIEIMNNDYTYHSSGDEVNIVANVVFKLTKAEILEEVEE